jgi:hypothetical protein
MKSLKSALVGTAALMVAMLSLTNEAFALPTRTCTGTVTSTGVGNDGLVYLTMSYTTGNSPNYKVCSVLTTHLSISAETCKQWASILLAGELSGRPVFLKWIGNSSGDSIDTQECHGVTGESSTRQSNYFILK